MSNVRGISKREEYTMDQRMSDLSDIVGIQCADGNWDANEYMRGMANGLLLAWHIMSEPYGTEVKFKPALQKEKDV